jgi:type I restriction enzyme S subunit
LLGGPYPFIQTGDVRKSEGFIETYEATYSEFGLEQSRLWPAGTLCITIAANIAETGILKFDACFPDSVVGFLNANQPSLTRYVELFLRTARTALERYAPATAQKNINLETLYGVAVPLPPPAEIERIVAELDKHLSVARKNEDAASAGVLRLQRLRQSILKWAFEGKLSDQDPNDEPASALLARIKAEQPAAPSRAPRKRGAR